MDKLRTGKALPVNDLLDADEEVVVRITGKTMTKWADIRSNNLLSDVSKGRLNPDRWFTFDQIDGLTKRYGLQVDDLIFVNIPVEIIKNWNKKYLPPMHAGNLAKKDIAVRLSPEKFGELAGLFRQESVGYAI